MNEKMSTELAISSGETSSVAVAAKMRALVETRHKMALYRPRDMNQVRQDIITECRRPAFADNKSAYYNKPIGNGVEGLGIRFTEMALRCMHNILIESEMTYEDDRKEIHLVTITDLENNVPNSMSIPITKSVERSKPMDDGTYLSMRKNSYGKMVYTVPAGDDDMLNKRAALIQKVKRSIGLSFIPGDIQDEAIRIIKEVRMNKAAKDPDAEARSIVDAFGELRVKASDLAEYLGHDIGRCSPAQLVNLRGIYAAIREGEATWAEVMDNKAQQGDGGAPPPAKPARKSEAATPPPPPPQQPTPPPPATPAPPAAEPEKVVVAAVAQTISDVLDVVSPVKLQEQPARSEPPADDGPPWRDDEPADAPTPPAPATAEPAGELATPGEIAHLLALVARNKKPDAKPMRMVLDNVGLTSINDKTLAGITPTQWALVRAEIVK